MSALWHAANLGKRGITLDLGHPDGLALGEAADRDGRRRHRELHAVGDGGVRTVLRRGASAQSGRGHAAVARLRPRGSVARPRWVRADDGADHRHGVADRIRRRSADHPRWRGRPDGGDAHRARARGRARAPGAHRRGSAGRDADGRGGGGGHGRAGHRRVGARHGSRPARRARGVPVRGRRPLDRGRRGIRSDGRGRTCRVVRVRARRRMRPPSWSRRGSRPPRWCPRTPCSTIPSSRRGASSRRSTIPTSARRSTRVGRCGCPPAPRWRGGGRRRRSVRTPTTCCASSVSADAELDALRAAHVIGTEPLDRGR